MRKSINPNDYANIKTGEILSSEIEYVTSVNVLDKGFTTLTSKEFITIDSDAFEYIRTRLSEVDIARIIAMSNMVDGEYNILYDRATSLPHTDKTLMENLQYSYNKFRLFINRLNKEGVICYISGHMNKVPFKHIMLNPNLARKSKRFNNNCLKEFQNFKFK
jgi:hypothetical protein